jgi:hypothetical protein
MKYPARPRKLLTDASHAETRLMGKCASSAPVIVQSQRIRQPPAKTTPIDNHMGTKAPECYNLIMVSCNESSLQERNDLQAGWHPLYLRFGEEERA